MTRTIEDVLAMEPTDLAKDQEALRMYVEYLRGIRENVVALEAAGKSITKKASKTKQEKTEPAFDLSKLVKET